MTEAILIKALVNEHLYNFHFVKNQQGLSHMLTHSQKTTILKIA